MPAKAPAPILILGAHGQLGQAFLRALGRRGVGWSREQLDLAAAAAFPGSATWNGEAPAAIINTAAFNQVDDAESHREQALAVNAVGPRRLARWARQLGCPLVHFSTDYVYGGDGLQRARTEADPPAPVNFYGYSKLLGEEAVLRSGAEALVVRVAHLYGGSSAAPGRSNLVERFLAQARAGQPIQVVRGQMLTPTAVGPLVEAVLQLLERRATGLFHLAGGEGCTAPEFATSVLRLAGYPGKVQEMDRDRRPALRPRHTVLENRRWAEMGLPPLPPWRESLAAYVAVLTGGELS